MRHRYHLDARTQRNDRAYAAVYRWVHGFALHFGQNRGAVADGKSEAVKAEVKAVTGK